MFIRLFCNITLHKFTIFDNEAQLSDSNKPKLFYSKDNELLQCNESLEIKETVLTMMWLLVNLYRINDATTLHSTYYPVMSIHRICNI